MSKDRYMGWVTVAEVKAEAVRFTEDGPLTNTVRIKTTSGKRIDVREGSIGFANALCIRPGDELEFEFTGIREGGYVSKKESDNGKFISVPEHLGVGTIKVKLGKYSDQPDRNLVQAGRSPMAFTERVVKAKDRMNPPPQPQTQTSGTSPFVEH